MAETEKHAKCPSCKKLRPLFKKAGKWLCAVCLSNLDVKGKIVEQL